MRVREVLVRVYLFLVQISLEDGRYLLENIVCSVPKEELVDLIVHLHFLVQAEVALVDFV